MSDRANIPHRSASGDRRRAERDIVLLGIIAASIIMLVGHASAVMPGVLEFLEGEGSGPAQWAASALLLNIALIIFGWRRYRDLVGEVEKSRIAEEEARELALTDPLTGSLNRRSILPLTEELVIDAEKADKAVAFVMIDLDNFKQINDLNGHRAGDCMLIEIAERIRAHLPRGAKLARLGGDEFACVVPYDRSSPDLIDQLAAKIIDSTRQPVQVNGGELAVGLSLGLSTSVELDQPGPNMAGELLHMADVAMYHAKKTGRNRYDWFAPEMERELKLRSELESGIRRGIMRGEFVPFYEQQVDVETGELTGFEMLARWQSPTLGLVTPDFFIPVAEEIGCIAELSEAVIGQALADASRWDPSLTLSVNISPIQLRDPWFAQKLLKLLAEAKFPPERLEIEVTESCLHENIGLVRSLVTSLKNQGVSVSLDDFGTGYASIAQLRALPFDRIKIDRSFIAELGRSGDNAALVSAITSIGKGMRLPVTAEGIESESVRDRLRGLGQFKGQGYFYGRPEPAEKVLARLKSEARLAEDCKTEPRLQFGDPLKDLPQDEEAGDDAPRAAGA
ncbi:putative bifunctional diguanylate cyclase/phosphodiesterase [Croceicoccus mobilis]|uniref:GGDEF-domain containing protein n=1 Tax=Croceicoccus mobilis TaxID=1703339 RepID=A0A916Z1Z4_9SPHN|nr:EAL domain-containing protein [Croceicoccus mobilis]GGD72896.1 hypothetical protein GCM10010990_23150 [Croceicoccus mobilis]